MNSSLRFFAVEKITFLYIFITTLIILFLAPKIQNINELLGYRLIIVATIITLAYFNSLKQWWILRFMRFIFLGALLSFWYPETFEINRVLPNLDFLLAGWEQLIFRCQPSLLFSQLFPQHWFSELMNMGYFSYYPLIIGTSLYFYFFNRKNFETFAFSVLFAFFCFYLIYIIFPTAGPQYYFSAIGIENSSTGIFPNIGHYFNENQTLAASNGSPGFFYHMVEKTQQVGERPTAAFPSSHVGITTLIMILVFSYRRYLLLAILTPFYIILVAATVYIKAHYAIDVIAGWIGASMLYYFSLIAYQQLIKEHHLLANFKALFLDKSIQQR